MGLANQKARPARSRIPIRAASATAGLLDPLGPHLHRRSRPLGTASWEHRHTGGGGAGPRRGDDDGSILMLRRAAPRWAERGVSRLPKSSMASLTARSRSSEPSAITAVLDQHPLPSARGERARRQAVLRECGGPPGRGSAGAALERPPPPAAHVHRHARRRPRGRPPRARSFAHPCPHPSPSATITRILLATARTRAALTRPRSPRTSEQRLREPVTLEGPPAPRSAGTAIWTLSPARSPPVLAMSRRPHHVPLHVAA